MVVRLFALLALVLCCSTGHAEVAVEIPLSEIWALNIPGTKDVRTLEPEHEKFDSMTSEERRKNSVVSQMAWRLSSDFRPKEGSLADAAFVVVGTGLKALQEANAVLAEKKPRTTVHSSGQEFTLVFYSYSSPRRIRLDQVTRTEREIIIKYHFHDPGLASSTRHFALIPMGSLPKGTYDVRIERLPDTGRIQRDLLQDYATGRRTVCESFTFGILDNNDNNKPKE